MELAGCRNRVSVYRGNLFHTEFQGAYFFMDFVQDWVKYVKFDANGDAIDADPSTAVIDAFNFDEGTTGPGGRYLDKMSLSIKALMVLFYMASILRGEIRGVVYNDPNGGNNPPVIDEQATVATPQGGLAVSFTGVASDPDPGDTLTYLWDFGDGNQSTAANPTHTYASNGQYTSTLVVSDGQDEDLYILDPIILGTPPTASVTVYKDAQFTDPFVDGVDLFKAGDTVYFRGDATDPDGVLTDPDSYNWDIRFLHDEHFHPEVNDFAGSSGSFQITTTEHGFLQTS